MASTDALSANLCPDHRLILAFNLDGRRVLDSLLWLRELWERYSEARAQIMILKSSSHYHNMSLDRYLNEVVRIAA
jgi:hypothetical protein